MSDISTSVFIFTGFLESGKTSAIQDVLLKRSISCNGKSLIICTETGEIEYREEFLREKNIEVIFIENQEEFTESSLEEINRKYSPVNVYIEVNGMWNIKEIMDTEFPSGWKIESIFSIVNAETYERYRMNMRQMIMEPLRVSDVIIFNRCSDNIKKNDIRSGLKIWNPTAEVFFMRKDGSLDSKEEEFALKESSGQIEIEETLFIPWFVDCIENTDKYYGKEIRMNAMVAKGEELQKNQFYAGRMAAICCAEDAQYIGFTAEYDGKIPKKGEWIELTAKIDRGVLANNCMIILLKVKEWEHIQPPDDSYIYL